jgi:hypothetical protein
MDDLSAAISTKADALYLTPHNHPDKPSRLHSLGRSLHTRFHQLGNPTDLNEAILKHKEAIYLTPDGHPDKPARLNGLGVALKSRFEHVNDPSDFHEMIRQYASAAGSTTGPAYVRFHAASMWAQSVRDEPQSMLKAYNIAIDLLAEVAWLGLAIDDRHHQIMETGSVVRDAAAAAISFGQIDKAVEWLEQGRSIIWGQLLNLRTSVDALKDRYPQLANNFITLSAQLERATTRRSHSQLLDPEYQAPFIIAQIAHENVQERHILLLKIRELQGFEDFLLPKKITQLAPAAQGGHVVLLNVSQQSCDALVCLPGPTPEVKHISLSQFTAGQAKTLTQSLGHLMPHMGCGDIDRLQGQREGGSAGVEDDFAHILSELWVRLVKPVLDALGITVSLVYIQ